MDFEFREIAQDVELGLLVASSRQGQRIGTGVHQHRRDGAQNRCQHRRECPFLDLFIRRRRMEEAIAWKGVQVIEIGIDMPQNKVFLEERVPKLAC